MTGIPIRRVLTLSVILSSLLIVSCESSQKGKASVDRWHEITGNTQGTTYKIILDDSTRKVKTHDIDSILHQFDLSLSTYVDNSIISQINAAPDSIRLADSTRYFARCYFMSRKIFELTEGAFDPSVYPLVKAWGFYGDELWVQSDADVNGILSYVGFDSGKIHDLWIKNLFEIDFRKHDSRFKLDFNAIAQGLSVDVLADYLDEKGVKNYFIEIGGEVLVKGTNREGEKWRIGIDSPKQNQKGTRIIENILNVSNRAVATSGNYRKFYVKDGVKYAHTINPKTGKPVQHSLLSATVVANTCAEADAYATSFMVLGVEKSLEFIEKHPELKLEAYLLYDEGDDKLKRAMTPGFKKYIK